MRVLSSTFFALSISLVPAVFGCGDNASKTVEADAAPDQVVSVDNCTYEDVPATSGAGGTVTAAPLTAGAAEAILDIPVGTALGAYTSRAGFLGTAGKVDLRRVPLSGSFNPSLGVESAPRVKALYMEAGDERTVIVRMDLGLLYEGLLFDVEERLGEDFHGKIILSASHSHSAWGQQTGSFIFQVGLGPFRELVYRRYVDAIEAVTREAIANARPAKIGIKSDMSFDSGDAITRDRREENDHLTDGPKKDSAFYMIRVDGIDDVGIAALPVYGVHGTIMGSDNPFASGDAPGGAERWLEEQFDNQVVVMHLQGAGGDASPRGYGQLDCANEPGNEGDPCFNWLSIEGHGRVALPALLQAYEDAGDSMETDLAMEMMTQSIETGPSPETFTIRDGALSYAPFERDREADREIYDGSGAILSPIDEFNAPIGAALCEADLDNVDTAYPLFPLGLMPGTDLLAPYGACVRVETAASILGDLLKLESEGVDETHPVCQSTRTTISALRLGDYMLGTIPGELTVMLADKIRAGAPVDADKTILLGYAQGHVGYCLTADDWLLGGYEPSINIWGPLEGEYIGERLLDLMPQALTPEREDAAGGGAKRVATNEVVDELIFDEPAPMSGVVPATIPEKVWLRTGPAATAQPAAIIPRVSGLATFVWIGDDPKTKTPEVTLERETAPDVFETIRRRSGRVLRSSDMLLMYTPQPLRREDNDPQTHYWAAEWQAVPWLGSQIDGTNLDGLESRAGVPLGRYRFRVKGLNFEITSDIFTVTEADLGVSLARSGSNFEASIAIHAPKGFRLLDMDLPSNAPVPVRSAVFDVTLQTSGAPMTFTGVSSDAQGKVTVDAGLQADLVTGITVTDSFGNTGSADL